MKKSSIVLIIVASALVALGLIIAFVGACMAKFDFGVFGKKLEVSTQEVSESFESINISSSVGKVILLPSADGKCVVEYSHEPGVLHDVSVSDGVLSINENDQRKWYEHIGLYMVGSYYTKIYLPEKEYKELKIKASTGDVQIPNGFSFTGIDIELSTGEVACGASASGLIKVKTTTGDVELENLSAGSLNISVSTGEVDVESVNCTGDVKLEVSTGESSFENVRCTSLTSVGTTGDIYLENVIVSGNIDIERSTGDVTFERSDASGIRVKTDTGKVLGTLLTDKVFYTKTDTGRVNVPKSTRGGICDIQTDTGRIEISVVS